jgi:beta-lactam-binding protein with PASTA domain
VQVPKLVGLAAADAVKRLQGLGLGATLKQTPAQQAPGTVVAQEPKSGARAKRGTPVALVVAKGAAAIVLPDVVGRSGADAQHELQQRGLNVNVVQVASTQAAGTVVAQSPPAQAKVQQGSTVRLNVARTAAKTTTATATTTAATTTAARTTTTRTATTPTTTAQSAAGNDYRGVRLGTAVQRIAQGRQQAVVQYLASSQPAGVVVANSSVGNRVKLQVSAGPHPQPSTDVPDTTGEDAATAQSDLTGAGFSVVTVRWPVSDASSDGTVVYQTPAASAPGGSTIVIYVGVSGG